MKRHHKTIKIRRRKNKDLILFTVFLFIGASIVLIAYIINNRDALYTRSRASDRNPYIQSVSPSYASIGDQVIIRGSSFGIQKDRLCFGLRGDFTNCQDGSQFQITDWSDGLIRAQVVKNPTIEGSGFIAIIKDGNNNLKSNLKSFSVTKIVKGPRISSIYPAEGKPGDSITIQGTGLTQTQDRVCFETSDGYYNSCKSGDFFDITSWNPNQITADIVNNPIAIGEGSIYLTTDKTLDISSNLSSFTIQGY